MKKNFRKLVSIVMALCLFLAVPLTSYAATTNESDSKNNFIYIGELKSDAEIKSFLADLDAHNKNSHKMWENALNQSNGKSTKLQTGSTSTNELVSNSIATALGEYSISTTSKYFNGVGVGAYVAYDKMTDTYSYFGTIYSIVVYAQNSDGSVGNVNTQYTKIDGGRTLAVNASFLLGYKDYTGIMHYYPVDSYIEFYTTGTGKWY